MPKPFKIPPIGDNPARRFVETQCGRWLGMFSHPMLVAQIPGITAENIRGELQRLVDLDAFLGPARQHHRAGEKRT